MPNDKQVISVEKAGKLEYKQVTIDNSRNENSKIGTGTRVSTGNKDNSTITNTVGEGVVDSSSHNESVKVGHSESLSEKTENTEGISKKEGISSKTGTTTPTTNRNLTSKGKTTSVSNEKANIAFRVRFSVTIESGGDTPDPQDNLGENCR